MKSSRPLSAHCRSSKTSTVGPRSAMRSKNVRQALNSCSRAAQSASSMPSKRSERGFEPAPFLRVGHEFVERRAQLLARRRFVLAFGDARPAADHLAQRPVGDTLAVGRRAALVPVVELRTGEPVKVLLELPDQPALADAGLPGDGHHAQFALALGRV